MGRKENGAERAHKSIYERRRGRKWKSAERPAERTAESTAGNTVISTVKRIVKEKAESIGRIRRVMFFVLAASMGTTEALLLIEGRIWDVIPLHLCSLSALAAGCLILYPRQWTLDFLWYLGMPGAALALLFPSPALSRFQALLTASYVTTHLLILIIPLYLMVLGMRPQPGRAMRMMLCLKGIALFSYGVNRLLDTNFLFLMAPPNAAPLVWMFSLGYPVYLIVLLSAMALLTSAMDRCAVRLFSQREK